MEKKFSPVPTEETDNRQKEPNPDELCGIGSFKPKWLQRFADPKVYLVIFCIIGVIEGAYFTYFVGVLSTLEKRFAFESKISGIILIADNISAAFLSLLVGYYGGKGHKPRMIAFGMILVTLSSFLSALPYFMYGPALHFLSKDASAFGSKKQEFCGIEPVEEECNNKGNTAMLPAVSILFIANFINGFGYTAYYTIGAPYLDDNVKKKNSPMYFRNSKELLVVTDKRNCRFCCFDTKCRCLQKYASKKTYTILTSILYVLQSAYFGYFIGIITTLEKRYAFRSQTTGLILIAGNISPLIYNIFVENRVGKYRKPRVIACCMFLVVLSCFLSALPYFIYGAKYQIFSKSEDLVFDKEYCDMQNGDFFCETEVTAVYTAVIILLIASFLNGFGYLPFHFLGVPYLDDYVNENSIFAHFGAMGALRIFGPALGFLLSSFCLKFYEDPFYEPGIDLNNPRWVGAWWMGFLILGVILLFFTVLLALFPRQLPERFRSENSNKEKEEEEKEEQKLPNIKDFPKEMKKLLKNPILVCHVISVTFQINGFAGYFVFMPKFMESQYQVSASDASLFSGATGIVSMLLGILLGGFVIMKYRPRPRYLTGYMVLVEIFSVLGLLVSIFLGCPPLQMPGTNLNADETLNLYNECNAGCSCTRRIFEPMCSADGVSTYFSPCFSGCPNLTGILSTAITSTISPTSNKTIFEECKCVAGLNNTFTTGSVTSGFCDSGCNMFMVYIIMLCISKFISSTARVGNTLITFRCVDAKDKSFALGAFGSVLATFAFIPYPLIYGALTDSACLVWEESCSKTGNCWLYDSDKFRVYLHGMSMLLISIGICFDGIVFLLSDRLKNFYGEDEDKRHSVDRIARWLKEEEEEDIIFTKCPKKDSLEIDPVI